MREHGFDVITISADGKEVEQVVKGGIKHIVIPFTRKITPIRDVVCLWKLVREIRKLKPDIVHTHTPKAGLLGMLASWICRVPVRLHTVAGLPLMEARGTRRKVLELVEKITCACAHKVYPNSVGLKDFLLHNLGLPSRKVQIIGRGSTNGIDTEYFKSTEKLEDESKVLRQKYGVKESDVIFSFVGRIVRDKGIVELVNAFRALADDTSLSNKYPERNLFLLLVGHFEEDLDPLPPDVMAFIMNDARVIMAGFQADVRPWVMASNVFVFPSYREGFPNVVMQASLLKVPCIVSDINGCNEIVKDGITGLIVPPKNAHYLAEAMHLLIEDDMKRQQFGEEARKFVQANFKREDIWEALRKEYAEMLERAGCSTPKVRFNI
jgi:glycosyltransferase involved in cell wall biosynthesis